MQIHDKLSMDSLIQSFQIDKLLQSRSNVCSECDESVKSFFCVDKHCIKRQLVCFDCSKNNINSQHYFHKLMGLKMFLLHDYPLTFHKLIQKFQNFKNIVSSSIEECQKLLIFLKGFDQQLEAHCIHLKQQLKESGLNQMLEKIGKCKKQEKPRKTTLEKIFENYTYYRPQELKNKISKIGNSDIFTKIQQIEKFKFVQNIQQKYSSLISSLEKEKLVNFISFQSEKILSFISDLPQITTQISSIPFQDQYIYLHSLNKAKQLDVSEEVSHENLYKILVSLPQLRYLKISYNNPIYQQNLSLRHQQLYGLELNYENYLSEQYLLDIFHKDKFPSLYRIILKNLQYNSNDQENLLLILKQDFSRIRSFELIREGVSFSDEMKWQILGFLEGKRFHEILLKGVDFTERQQEKYRQIVSEKSFLLRSYTRNEPEVLSWKSIVFSFAQYKRYKYISKRTYKNIALNILT